MGNIGRIEKKKEDKAWWQPGLTVFFRLSAWIAVPVLIGAFVGKRLDRKYDSEPWLFLASVGLAFFISMFGLIKNTITEYKKIEKEFDKDPKQKNNQLSDNDKLNKA